MNYIKTLKELREVYPPAKERSVRKQMSELDVHARNFISKAPIVFLATIGSDGLCDCTPRGGEPGYVKVKDGRVLLPDWPGNYRLDSLENILTNPGVGLLFMIPGFNETLRVNGKAMITTEKELLDLFITNGKTPRSILLIDVIESYLHCGKALLRSDLWNDESKIDRNELPSMGQMLNDQMGAGGKPETQQETVLRQMKELY